MAAHAATPTSIPGETISTPEGFLAYCDCMRLRHAILGLLSHAPQSGYDLNRAFNSSIVYFWYADQSQVYRTLDRLEAGRARSIRGRGGRRLAGDRAQERR